MPNKLISFIIPIHNESRIIEKNINRLVDYCRKHHIKAEILLCENGSSDASEDIIKKLKYKEVRKIYLNKRGLGSAYRAGIKAASNQLIYFTGMDFPFGFKNILDCYSQIDKHDLVLASKAHKKSVIRINLKRLISSFVYQSLHRFLLKMKTGDAQGCAMFYRKKILKYLKYCDSNDAFFQTQLALYGEMAGLSILEIPVCYINPRNNSKFSVSKDGWQMLKQMLKERKKLTRYRKGCSKK